MPRRHEPLPDSAREKSPNPRIDDMIQELLDRAMKEPSDTAVKIVNTAISWEKVKAGILDKDAEFDPDAM